jgi:thiol-disulfide isomerase/thioredoxin
MNAEHGRMMRQPRGVCLGISIFFALWIGGETVCGENAGVLRFDRDNYLAGRLAPASGPDKLCWQHPDFIEPFCFPLRTIAAANFPAAAPERQAPGTFGFELVSGTRFFGRPLRLEDEWLVVETARLGTRRVEFSAVRKIFRWLGRGELGRYLETDQLNRFLEISERVGQQETGEAAAGTPSSWKDVGGRLEADGPAGPLFRDIGLEPHSTIELELTWEEAPNFVVALGSDGTPESARQAFRLEVWNGSLVILRELEQRASVRVLQSIETLQGRLRLTIDLDQRSGRAVVYDVDGRQLADQRVPVGSGAIASGIQLENISGHVRVDRIDVLRGGASTLAGDVQNGAVRLLSVAGESLSGQVRGIDEEAIMLQIDGEQRRFAWEEVSLIGCGEPAVEQTPADSESQTNGEAAAAPAAESSNDSSQPQYISLAGGVRLIGYWLGNDERVAKIEVQHWAEPVEVPLSLLRGIHVRDKPSVKAGLMPGRSGVLQLAGTRVRGVLDEAMATDQHSSLRFAPRWALQGAHLKHSASGVIIYRDPTPVRVPEPPQRENRGGLLGAVVQVIAGPRDGTVQRLIHLRSGDVVPARVRSIGPSGVMIDSIVTGEKLIPHEEVKAVELKPMEGSLSLEQAKRERLLTIPRIRKNSPPKHLLVSVDGDYLRGNLLRLDEETVVVESRLRELELPTRYLAKIIWFHEDEISGEEADAAPAASQKRAGERSREEASRHDGRLRLQAVQSNGIRLTFRPEEAGGGELVGSSDLLGVCLVDLKNVDRLLFGDAIAAAEDELLFYEWRLSHAPEPSVYSETDAAAGGGATAGTESPLVGQPAPEFSLRTLDGEPITVAQFEGRVLVLDFWASWCGPCLQAMPQIHAAVEQFPEDQVALVAVNLQEGAEQIRAALERLELSPTVALDIDGVAAARYQANAIPQTVVIDRRGEVARLFVGGGSALQENLVAAIEAALEGEKAE